MSKIGEQALAEVYASACDRDLAVGGQDGVEQVIRNLAAETDLTMALCGASRFADIKASMVTREP